MRHARVNLVVDEEVDAPHKHSAGGVDERAMNGRKLVGHGKTEKIVERDGAPVQQHLQAVTMGQWNGRWVGAAPSTAAGSCCRFGRRHPERSRSCRGRYQGRST